VCETPPNSGTNLGVATFYYSPNQDPSSNIVVGCRVDLPQNFSPTSAGIYGPANPGQRGAFIFDLGQSSLVTNVTVGWDGIWISVTNVNRIYNSNFTVTPQQNSDIKAGLWYVEVSSIDYPAGEIRGQINKAPVILKSEWDGSGGFMFKVHGPLFGVYEVDISTNLVDWSVFSRQYIEQSIDAVDPRVRLDPGFWLGDQTGTNHPVAFYRVGIAQ